MKDGADVLRDVRLAPGVLDQVRETLFIHDSLHCLLGAGCSDAAMLEFGVGIGVDALVDDGAEVVVVFVESRSYASTISSVAAWRSQWNWNSCR